MDFVQKEKYDINDLLEITRILRSENGCPWDREQDHKSIRMDLLEETYEVMEAIDCDDAAMLREELGDLLFQSVFHCQIEAERGRFDFNDVCDEIAKKMIYRHPHVFGDVSVNNSDEVLVNWEKLKQASKHQSDAAATLESVPNILPALMRGQKIAKRSADAGLAFSDTDSALSWVKENVENLNLAILDKNDDKIDDTFGKLLMSCCILSRFIKKDSEKALTFAINKFIIRFRDIERQINESGRKLEDLSADELDKLWQSVIGR